MKKKFFSSYINVLLFVTVTVLLFSVAFTLITGVSPLEALNISPLLATIMLVGVVLTLIALPIVVARLRKRGDEEPDPTTDDIDETT